MMIWNSSFQRLCLCLHFWFCNCCTFPTFITKAIRPIQKLFNHFLKMGTGVTASLFLLTSGCLCLICLRKLHSSIGFPFHVCIDNVDNYASVGRRLKSEVEVVISNNLISNVCLTVFNGRLSEQHDQQFT